MKRESIDEKEAEKTARRMQEGKFDLEDFLSTMKQMKKLGPLENLIKLIPGAKKMGLTDVKIDPKQMAHIEAIVLSMTPEERHNPDIIKVLDKVGELIKNILRLNKLIEVRFINKELDSMVNNLFSISHALMQMQIMCFK